MANNQEFVETLPQNKHLKAKQLMQVDFYRGAIHDKPGTIVCAVRIRGGANSLIIILYSSLSNFQFMPPNNNGNWI